MCAKPAVVMIFRYSLMVPFVILFRLLIVKLASPRTLEKASTLLGRVAKSYWLP